MKGKRIIRFYFSADKLNGALDNLIMADACKFGGQTERYIENIIKTIEIKKTLATFWQYLDGIISEFSEGERVVLRFYGSFRRGIKCLSERQRREIKRVTVKFRRHARFIGRYGEAIALIDRYNCLF